MINYATKQFKTIESAWNAFLGLLENGANEGNVENLADNNNVRPGKFTQAA